MELSKYIGLSYSEYSCYDLVRKVQAELFNVEMPAEQVPETHKGRVSLLEIHPERNNWAEVSDVPVDGDLVLIGRSGRASHIGTIFWLPSLNVLHTTELTGSVLQRVKDVSCGEALRFYRRKS